MRGDERIRRLARKDLRFAVSKLAEIENPEDRKCMAEACKNVASYLKVE